MLFWIVFAAALGLYAGWKAHSQLGDDTEKSIRRRRVQSDDYSNLKKWSERAHERMSELEAEIEKTAKRQREAEDRTREVRTESQSRAARISVLESQVKDLEQKRDADLAAGERAIRTALERQKTEIDVWLRAIDDEAERQTRRYRTTN
ncbi:MAG: hypothetical protein S0880_37570 [Actinomycetota bacterium]|nr:hypothetical protein [Actinomycetota bacterium]